MAKPIIQVRDITKSFNNGQNQVQILRGISLDIATGEFVAISGPSGCGKSTLLNILGLLDTADFGEYYLEGNLVSNLDARGRSSFRGSTIGFVFQSFNLIDDYTVLENVALPLKYSGVAIKQQKAQALLCLQKVGLEDKADLLPSQISGGQQQRVSIARALAGDSGILLVDEPTGNLDSKNGDAVMELLVELNNKGTTIVLVTHDARYAEMATRTVAMVDGIIVQKTDINTEAMRA